jgi:hypothetical protein
MALGSHLPFPMNVNAPKEASTPHEYLAFETHPRIHRRRATLPSVVFSSADAATLNAYWAADGQWSTAPEEQNGATGEDSPVIGVAVSSPTFLKRRSRSAGALQQAAHQQAEALRNVGSQRRRSAEIRYWRSSTAMDRDSVPEKPHFSQSRAVENLSGLSRQPPEESGTLQIEPEQAAAFNFGDLSGGSHDEEDGNSLVVGNNADAEAVSEKKEESSHPNVSDVVLKEDTDHLSSPSTTSKTEPPSPRIEEAVDKTPKSSDLSRDSPSVIQQGLRIPPSTPTHRDIHSSSTARSLISPHSMHSLHSVETAVNVPTPIQGSNTPSPAHPLMDIRPGQIAEHFASIHAILQHERAARKKLEEEVMELKQALYELRNTVNRTDQGTNPITSPATTLSTPRNQFPARSAHQKETGYHGIGFAYPHLDDIGDYDKRQTVLSHFSKDDSDDGDSRRSHNMAEDEITDTESKASARSPELWETPKEEIGPYGFPFDTPLTNRIVAMGDKF